VGPARARALSLVDELGGLSRVAIAARAKIPGAAGRRRDLSAKPRLVEFVPDLVGSAVPGAAAFSALLRPPERRALAQAAAPVRLFQPGEPLALMPYVVVR
jgi:hypothetical protein